MKKTLKHNWLYIFLIMVLVSAQAYFSFLYRQIGDRADKIDAQYHMLKLNIQKIKSDIAQNRSLLTIEKKAKALGFIRAANYIYLDPNE